MKKLLCILALGAFVACGNEETTTDTSADTTTIVTPTAPDTSLVVTDTTVTVDTLNAQ